MYIYTCMYIHVASFSSFQVEYKCNCIYWPLCHYPEINLIEKLQDSIGNLTLFLTLWRMEKRMTMLVWAPSMKTLITWWCSLTLRYRQLFRPWARLDITLRAVKNTRRRIVLYSAKPLFSKEAKATSQNWPQNRRVNSRRVKHILATSLREVLVVHGKRNGVCLKEQCCLTPSK